MVQYVFTHIVLIFLCGFMDARFFASAQNVATAQRSAEAATGTVAPHAAAPVDRAAAAQQQRLQESDNSTGTRFTCLRSVFVSPMFSSLAHHALALAAMRWSGGAEAAEATARF